MAPYVNLKTPNWNKCSVTKDLHVFLLVLASADCHGRFAVVGNWALRVAHLLNVQGHTPHVCCAQVAHTQLPNHELEGLTWTGLSHPHTCTCSPPCIRAHVRTDPPCLYLLEHMQAISKQHSASLSGRWQVEWRLIHHPCLCRHALSCSI